MSGESVLDTILSERRIKGNFALGLPKTLQSAPLISHTPRMFHQKL